MRYPLTIFGKALAGVVVVLLIAVAVVFVLSWWGARIPSRPKDISENGVFLERGAVPFQFSTHGDWADCWQDSNGKLTRCRFTDEAGVVEFEDVFISETGTSEIRAGDLKIDTSRTASLRTSPPLIFLHDGDILLPRSQFEKAKQVAAEWAKPK